MKLTLEQRLDIAMEYISEKDLELYEQQCASLESEEAELDSIPAECENKDCGNCSLSLYEKREIDCPYVEEGRKFSESYCPNCGEDFISNVVNVDYCDENTIDYYYICPCCELPIFERHVSYGFEVEK